MNKREHKQKLVSDREGERRRDEGRKKGSGWGEKISAILGITGHSSKSLWVSVLQLQNEDGNSFPIFLRGCLRAPEAIDHGSVLREL